MPDLLVDTDQLRSAAVALRRIAQAAADLGGRSGGAVAAIPSLGLAGPAQAMDSFLAEWMYGVGWIGAQAHELARIMLGTAAAFETVETTLARGLAGRDTTAAPDVVTPADIGPAPEPIRRATGIHWGDLAASTAPMPVQLSSARHVRDLVAGDPDRVAGLAGILTSFADAVADARTHLAFVNLGTWRCATATLIAHQLEQIQRRLATADASFFRAASAVRSYALVHSAAHRDANTALMRWQTGDHVSKVWRGVIPGVAPAADSADDPGAADMAFAARTLALALESWEAGGRRLAAELLEAEQGAPDDPGAMSMVARAFGSLGAGVVQGLENIATSAVGLAVLGEKILPLRAFWDPEGYICTWETIAMGVIYGAAHPGETALQFVSWDQLKSNPARWLGQVLPEALMLLSTAGAAGAEKSAEATEKLETAAQVVQQARREGRALGPRFRNRDIERVLSQRRIDAASPSGRAIRQQMRWGRQPDDWFDRTLQPGQRIAMPDDFGFATPVMDTITTKSNNFFEGLQLPATRPLGPDGVGMPQTPGSVRVYEIRDEIPASQSIAKANPHLGAGGDSELYVPDFRQALNSGRIVELDPHTFDPRSLQGRMEDPAFRHADPTLPERALSPASERAQTSAKVAGVDFGRGALKSAIVAADHVEPAPRPGSGSNPDDH